MFGFGLLLAKIIRCLPWDTEGMKTLTVGFILVSLAAFGWAATFAIDQMFAAAEVMQLAQR